jgi:hypothetical protein
MPRGIPNVKRDESQGMRYTTFHVPAQCVATITHENVLLKCFSKAQPKAHEYVVPEIREPDNMGPEGGT